MSQLVEKATRTLEAAGIDTARADAEWLLAALMGCGRLGIYLPREVPAATAERYELAIRRRASGEPVQQIMGWEEFRGLRLTVTADVLIPRPETEVLVDRALELLPSTDALARVVDVGTGSGAIACALASERRRIAVLAIDTSIAAARVARENCRSLGVGGRVRVVAGDVLSCVRPASVDLVVSNPPYLSDAMLEAAPREVREREPTGALLGGLDGLAILRRLVVQASRILKSGAPLIVETAGASQVDAVAALFEDAGYVDVRRQPDLAGVLRFVSGHRSRVPSVGVVEPAGAGPRIERTP